MSNSTTSRLKLRLLAVEAELRRIMLVQAHQGALKFAIKTITIKNNYMINKKKVLTNKVKITTPIKIECIVIAGKGEEVQEGKIN